MQGRPSLHLAWRGPEEPKRRPEDECADQPRCRPEDEQTPAHKWIRPRPAGRHGGSQGSKVGCYQPWSP
jgi:hypothetical protein